MQETRGYNREDAREREAGWSLSHYFCMKKIIKVQVSFARRYSRTLKETFTQVRQSLMVSTQTVKHIKYKTVINSRESKQKQEMQLFRCFINCLGMLCIKCT